MKTDNTRSHNVTTLKCMSGIIVYVSKNDIGLQLKRCSNPSSCITEKNDSGAKGCGKTIMESGRELGLPISVSERPLTLTYDFDAQGSAVLTTGPGPQAAGGPRLTPPIFFTVT